MSSAPVSNASSSPISRMSSSRSSTSSVICQPPVDRLDRRDELCDRRRLCRSVVFHRGPQAVLVEPEHVHLGLLARARRHDRSTLLVHVEHQLGRLLLRVAEQLLEHVGDVAHQVHRVVPHQHDPRTVEQSRGRRGRARSPPWVRASSASPHCAVCDSTSDRIVVSLSIRVDRFASSSERPVAEVSGLALASRERSPYDGPVMAVGSRPLVPSRLAPGGVAHGSRRTPTTVIGAYVALTKPRIIELLLITTVPTMVLAEQGWPACVARGRHAARRDARRRRCERRSTCTSTATSTR